MACVQCGVAAASTQGCSRAHRVRGVAAEVGVHDEPEGRRAAEQRIVSQLVWRDQLAQEMLAAQLGGHLVRVRVRVRVGCLGCARRSISR